MNASGSRNFGAQILELQRIVWRMFRGSRQDEGSLPADVDLPEKERYVAVEREAERREQEGA